MQGQIIFQDEKEIARLRVQNELLAEYEVPGFEKIFASKEHLAVLDIGCNNGTKTAARFSSDAVDHVIGVEYNKEVADAAQAQYGDDRFSFFSADIESEDFEAVLRGRMEEKGIGSFDIIYMSFVLMHLHSPELLLKRLHPYLKKDGKLVVIERWDEISYLKPDEEGLLDRFLSMLREDKYAGRCREGKELLSMLKSCGYDDIAVWSEGVRGMGDDPVKKENIFTTYFSFFPEDLAILLREEPDNPTYRSWKTWTDTCYPKLKHQILSRESDVFMGTAILACGRKK